MLLTYFYGRVGACSTWLDARLLYMYSWTYGKRHFVAAEVTNSIVLLPFRHFLTFLSEHEEGQ